MRGPEWVSRWARPPVPGSRSGHEMGSGRCRGHRCSVLLTPRGRNAARWPFALCVLVLLVLGGCSREEVIVKTADGVELVARDIDADPLALMPGGAVLVANVQTREVLQTAVAERMAQLMNQHMPIPASANFVPERDLERLVVGLYSLQGVDFAGVAQGRFDRDAIAAAAREAKVTPLGTPLVRVEYSNWEFYVSANVGFAVLTPNTLLFGNETGMRRALDRLERGELRVDLPPLLEALLRQPGAPVALGSDLEHDPQVQALGEQMTFLKGLKLARVVANFDPPGMHFAGTFTYPSEEQAEQALQSARSLHKTVTAVGVVAKAIGIRQPLQQFEASRTTSSIQATAAIDSQATAALLDLLAGSLRGERRATVPVPLE